MRRLAVALVALAALAVPAHAAAASDAVSPRQTVRSADGLLTLTIPRGAVTKPVRVRIRTLRRSAIGGEMRKAAAPGPIYELLPAGLRFARPITITRRVNGLDLRNGVPVLVPAALRADGRWAALRNARVERRGRVVTVSGTTREFAQVAAFGGAVKALLTPPHVAAAVGTKFRAVARLSGAPGDYEFGRSLWAADGSVSLRAKRDRPDELEADLECRSAGAGSYRVHFEIVDRTAAALFVAGIVWGTSERMEVRLHGTAVCGGAETPKLAFTLGWNHPAGSATSLICIGITASSGALIRVEAEGPGGYSAAGTLQLKEKESGSAPGTFTLRISQIGRYTIRVTATVGGKSVTKSRVLDVTDAAGTGTCTR